MSAPVCAYRARWIVPVEGHPLEGGYLILRGDRILSVLPRWSGPATDLGDVALIPGLVNCHTHLEFSLLREPLDPPRPFAAWIERVVTYRQQMAGQVSQAIRDGLKEVIASGTTVLGEIATQGWTWDDYRFQTPRSTLTVFQEFLGLTHERVLEQEAISERFLMPIELPPYWQRGFSPHAPYSVHPALIETIARYAVEHPQYPVAVHLAESTAERDLLEHDRGELHDLLMKFGIWMPGLFGGRRALDWLELLADLPRALVIHGNHLDQEELRFMAQHPHLTLVYCPRTHAAAESAPHPWHQLMEIGGSVAIGTDSRATNPDLSLWRELQFIAEQSPPVPHHSILRLGTLAGARALGLSESHGSLVPGKQADLAVVALDDAAFQDPVYDLLAPGNRVVGTMIAGEWAVRPPG